MYFNFITNKEYELSHVGGLHGNKKEKLAQLTSKGLDISLIDPKFTSYSDYLEAYHKSVASICLTSNSVNTGPQSKTRLAELPYYCVLVSEPWPNMEMWNMEPNKDFILIDESDNYVELIQKCFRDKNFCENMYQSAKSILINSNTVFHEWNRIMRNIDEDYTEIDVNKLMDNFNLQ
jgi:hypothetical protein